MVSETVRIKPLNHVRIALSIRGTAPLVVHRFSQKAARKIEEQQRAGSTRRSKKEREARDFEADFERSLYTSADGWHGFNAAAIRNAMISACRTVGFVMTLAKLSLFVDADGFDREDSTPLVRIYGEPKLDLRPVRNQTGVVDLRARPMWPPGWTATLLLRYDAEQFATADVVNLIARVGAQVGIGEGRPDSKKSAGLGWGLFEVAADA